jgi:putative transposase
MVAARPEAQSQGATRSLGTIAFLIALCLDRVEASWPIDGPINAKGSVSMSRVLVPTLEPGELVIMDNLGSHKGRPELPAI